MSTNNLSTVLKSCSESELINEMAENSMAQKQVEGSRLKRTFTLPRNPFGTTKPGSSKNKCNENEIKPTSTTPVIGETTKDDNVERKLFRRPSWKRFLNKIAQHMSTVHVSGVSINSLNKYYFEPVASTLYLHCHYCISLDNISSHIQHVLV